MEQVKLWITSSSGSMSPLAVRDQIEYEHNLEDMLAAHPDMLGDDLTPVGRQLRTAGGPLDLLGVDHDGKLVLYELKRGATPREALTQAIDYASWLDTLEFDELARRISEHQPSGVDRGFNDFDDWYTERFSEDQAQQLRPTRIVLVGLGIEPSAERMAHWLRDKGVDIEAIAFHAFDLDGRTVLARQIEVSPDDTPRAANRSAPPRPEPLRRAAEFNAVEVYQSAYQLAASCFGDTQYSVHTYKNGVNFALPPTDDRKSQRATAYIGVFVRIEGTGQLNVYIRQAAIAACPQELEQLLERVRQLGLRTYRPPSRNVAAIIVDGAEFERAKTHIAAFTDSAVAAWRRDWDQGNAGATPDDVDMDGAAPTRLPPSALPANDLDGSD